MDKCNCERCTSLEAAWNYIDRIRNNEKAAYAKKYLMTKVFSAESPERGDLSFMAAQAIMLELDEIFNHTT